MSISDFPIHNMKIHTVVYKSNGSIASDVTKDVSCSFLCVTSLGYVPHFLPLIKGGNTITNEIFNSQVVPYFSNITYSEMTNWLEGNQASCPNTFFTYNWTAYSGYYADITIEGESPVVLLANDNHLWRNFECEGPLLYASVSNYPVWNLPAVGFAIAMAMVGKEKEILYHDIYIDGTDKPPIYIHTHHNLKTGVTSYIQWSATDISGAELPELTNTYDRLGASQYDKGMIQSYTFENAVTMGIKNQRLDEYEASLTGNIQFYFKDVIIEAGYPAEYVSEVVNIFQDGTHSTGERKNEFIIIRFFEGLPPQEVIEDSDSGDNPDFPEYDGDKGQDKDSDYSTTDDIPDGSLEGSAGIFHDIYKVTTTNMKAIHNKIWTQDYFDVLKVNENPIENIVAAKRYPFSVESSGSQQITIGNINIGVSGDKIENGVAKIPMGSLHLTQHYKNFLDYYSTNVSIFLPYIGFHVLNPLDVMNKDISIIYLIDIMTGVCKAQVFVDNELHFERDGQMGIDCTLTASTQKQAEIANASRYAGAITSGVTAVGSMAAGGANGVINGLGSLVGTATTFANSAPFNHFQSTSSNASIANASKIQPFLLIDRPLTVVNRAATGESYPWCVYPSDYKHTVGLPCGNSYKINQLSGFVKTGSDITGKFTNATQREVDEIRSILMGGFEI